MSAPISHLLAEAVALGGGNLCAAGHDWQSDGGRACPKDGFGSGDGCSQAIYRCSRCGVHDYGDKGGPAHRECFVECSYDGSDEPNEVTHNRMDDGENLLLVTPEVEKGNDMLEGRIEDTLYEKAKLIARSTDKLCIANLQRQLLIGYNRASRLMEAMIDDGMVERYDIGYGGIGYRLVTPS